MTSLLRRVALLRLKVETDLARAVETTARQRGQTMSEFTRQGEAEAQALLLPTASRNASLTCAFPALTLAPYRQRLASLPCRLPVAWRRPSK
jgi:hypothetical protein